MLIAFALSRAHAGRKLGVLEGPAELIVTGHLEQVLFEAEDEEDLHPGSHRNGARAALDSAQRRPAYSSPLGHHLRAEIAPKPGETNALAERG